MRKQTRINDLSPLEITKAFLEEQPDVEGKVDLSEPIVVAKTIPEYEDIIFMNNRDPGVALMFHYHSATHPLKHYTLYHGNQHRLPVEVIRHLEGETPGDDHSCHIRMYGRKVNPEGLTENYISGYKANFQCKSIRR